MQTESQKRKEKERAKKVAAALGKAGETPASTVESELPQLSKEEEAERMAQQLLEVCALHCFQLLN